MPNSEEEKVKDLLENLPTFKDDLSKDELFERLSMHIPEKQVENNKRFLPFISAAAVFFLLLSLPFFKDIISDEQMSMEMDNSGNEEEILMTAIESSDSFNKEINQEESIEGADSEGLTNESGVIQQIPPGHEIIHFNIHNNSKKFILPIALIVPREEETSNYTERMSKILESYGLLQENDVVEEMDLNEEKASFLLYQGKYYASLPQEDKSTISEALQIIQNYDQDSSLENTITPAANFMVNKVNDLLELQFEAGTIQDEDITIQMIESILLTAKSYGFSEVLFKQMPTKGVGDYQFSTPISTQVTANPLIGPR